MKSRVRSIFLSLALLVGGPALACDSASDCPSFERWAVFDSFSLAVSSPGEAAGATWKGRVDGKSNDILIEADVPGDSGRLKGTVALVGGRVLLTRDLKLPAGAEIDALDAPLLSMQLAISLLDRVFPEGPVSIPAQHGIDHRDPKAISIGTSSAGGRIAAPWHVTGRAGRAPNGTVSFDLTLEAPAGGARSDTRPTRLTGELAQSSEPVFRDDTSLAGWTAYGVGPRESKSGGSTILDYGASQHDGPAFRTIADVRAYIAQKYRVGTRDAPGR